jgi:hypothetical protein
MALKNNTVPATNEAAVVEPVAVAPAVSSVVDEKADERREKEINSFLNEFAHNDNRRRVLRAAIESGEEVTGGTPYFQARLKKIQGK